jgi:hypothetical protein
MIQMPIKGHWLVENEKEKNVKVYCTYKVKCLIVFGYKLEIPTIVYLSVLSQMEMKSVCTFLPAQINHVELTTMVFNYETPIVRFHPN